MKKICLILFSLLMIFSINMNVFAGVASDGRPAGVDNDDPASTDPNRYDTYKYNSSQKEYFTGIRVSFVTNTGKDIATYDYVNNNQLNGNFGDYKFNRFNPYYISQRCSKAAYATGNCSIIKWTSYTAAQVQNKLTTTSALEGIFAKYHFKSGDITGSLLKGKMDASSFVTNYWFKKSSYTGSDYDTDLKGLLSYFVGEEYLTDENVEKLFVVVEPTSIMTLKGYHYYGTAYELANIADDTDAYINNKYTDSSTALKANIPDILRNTLPCSAILSGDINTAMKDKGKTVSGFSNNLYFGKIKIDYSSYKTTCGSGNLDVNMVTGNYGVGMAVVWMYDFWNVESLSCKLINGTNKNYNTNKPYCDSIDDLIDEFVSDNEKYFGKEEYVKNFYISHNCCVEPTPSTTPSCQTIVDNAEGFKGRDYRTITKDEVLTLISQFKQTVVSQNLNYTIPTAEEYWNKCGEDDKDEGRTINPTCDLIISYAALKGVTGTPECSDIEKIGNIVKSYNSYVLENPFYQNNPLYNLKQVEEDYVYQYKEVLKCPCVTINEENKVDCDLVYGIVSTKEAVELPTCGDESTYDSYIDIFNDYLRNSTISYDRTEIDYEFMKSCDCQEVIEYRQPSCEEIYRTTGYSFTAHYPNGINGTDIRTCSSVVTDTIVSTFNAMVDAGAEYSKIDKNYFNSVCPCDNGGRDCEPEAGVNNCNSYGTTVIYNDNNGSYSDEQDFIDQCVVNKTSKLDSNLTQTYCKVYCYEDLEMSLAKFNIPVTAGRFVAFNTNYTNTVSGSRTCYTEPDVEGYKSALESANRKMLEEYAKLYSQQKKQEAIAAALRSGREDKVNCDPVYKSGGIKYCMSYSVGYEDSGRDRTSTTPLSSTNTCRNVTKSCVDVTDPVTGEVTEKCTWRCDIYTSYKYCKSSNYDPNRRHYTRYQGKSGYVYVNGITEDWSFGSWCSNQTAPTANTSSKEYDTAKREVENLITSMNSCTSWDDDDLYNLEPTLSLTYDDGYKYNHVTDLEISDYEDDTYTTLKTPSGYSSWIYSCSGSSCSKITREQVYSRYKKMRTIDISYELPNDTYNYIVKTEGVISSMTKPTANYVLMGGNLPVAFGSSGTGKLNIDYSGLGHNSDTGYRTKIEDTLSSDDDYGKWYCDFNITPGLVTESGLKLVYRTIDLNNPFPDIDGEGRKVGSNWCASTGTNKCSNTNSLVQSVIKTDVMQNEPMYTFTLTPTTLMYIRDYNKNNSYTDFNMKCEEKTGKACVSNFLTDLIGRLNGINETYSGGKCEVARTGTKNDFYGCEPEPYID